MLQNKVFSKCNYKKKKKSEETISEHLCHELLVKIKLLEAQVSIISSWRISVLDTPYHSYYYYT